MSNTHQDQDIQRKAKKEESFQAFLSRAHIKVWASSTSDQNLTLVVLYAAYCEGYACGVSNVVNDMFGLIAKEPK